MPERVAILYSGGTIGMGLDASRALLPDPDVLARHLDHLWGPDIQGLPAHDLCPLLPLRDSADLGPRDWWRIADAIVQSRARYRGFVVVHGTDTLAYTASALSFMLEGLDCPVVVTGAQLSLIHPRSDGRENLSTALMLASAGPDSAYCQVRVPEVMVYFARALLRGNRTQKFHTSDFVAFRSTNYPPLGRVGVNIEIADDVIRSPGGGLGASTWSPAQVMRAASSPGFEMPKVAAFRIYPGLDAAMLERFLDASLDAVVLETYGSGTIPSGDPALTQVLARAIGRGIVIVNCSQCPGGRVEQGRYGAGAALARIGVIGAQDMTPEATLTKLHYAFARYRDPVRVAALMASDLAGELTFQP